MVRVGIISWTAAYGNAAALAVGMRHFADVATWYKYADEKGFEDNAKIRGPFPDCDCYVIIGALSIGLLLEKYHKRRIAVILTDSTYMMNAEKYNKIIARKGWQVFAMPDLAYLNGTKNIYYQPFVMPKVDKRKTNLVCHSPYCDKKEIQKGTTYISAVCTKNNLPLTIIKGKTWQETIREKATHLICIDQLFRGIGKSGLEAMLLDCVVLTGRKPAGNHLPPVVWTDKNNLSKDLLDVIFNGDLREDIITRQRLWAEKNLNPEYAAGKIFEKL